MAITAVIFDAFGTTLRIGTPMHPYRRRLREGAKNGRRPSPGDLHELMTIDAGLREAADILGIQVTPSRMAEIEFDLQREIESIEVFPDACDAIALLHEHGVATAICSNLAAPYGPAVKKLLPDINAYSFSYELGVTKPNPAIYRAVCHDLGIVPGHLFGGAAQVAMIGDSPRCDRDGPRAIGIKGFYLNRSGTEAIRDLMQFAKLVVEQSEQQPTRLVGSNDIRFEIRHPKALD
ncbi:HAD family hydrolase [Pseudomonas fulva]|uniref:HAD family hydrolase n=1 Tax=Pseudomonas fulva TaxID=47880 RepID=UPI0015E2D0B7|nr:HAD family hydrolase [Pseudomonas fulva]MBA1216469.1 HAD family hydrolase [Pseudomonas fulva]